MAAFFGMRRVMSVVRAGVAAIVSDRVRGAAGDCRGSGAFWASALYELTWSSRGVQLDHAPPRAHSV